MLSPDQPVVSQWFPQGFDFRASGARRLKQRRIMVELGRFKFLLVDIRTKEYGHSAYEVMMAMDFARSRNVPVYVVNTLSTPNKAIYRLHQPGGVLLKKSWWADALGLAAFRVLYRDLGEETRKLKSIKLRLKEEIAALRPPPKEARPPVVTGKKMKKKALKEQARLAAQQAEPDQADVEQAGGGQASAAPGQAA